MTSRDLAVVVVAAGLGTRLGADKPKAFVTLAEKTLIQHALENIAQVPALEQVIIAVPAGHEAQTAELADAALAGLSIRFDVVIGGDSRQQSIFNALGVIDQDVAVILVHDAARALAPASLFVRVASEVRRSGVGAVPLMKIADTVKRIEGEVVRETVDRNSLRAAQTPQGFVAKDLIAAYAAADSEYTDDAALAQAHGMQINAVDGDERAFKITTADDLAAAELRFGGSDSTGLNSTGSNSFGNMRTGIGSDVHRFSDDADKALYLGTVVWPGERGLDGHSDGDAVSHAIVDALLSAAGLGDIGANFGVDRPEFSGANGRVFIEATLELLKQNGFGVVNVAVQIIGNRPKVSPMRIHVETVLSEIVGAPVTLGATTTDGLGFLGNDEGVAAVATALIVRNHPELTTGPKVG